jgi:hypothetical protein
MVPTDNLPIIPVSYIITLEGYFELRIALNMHATNLKNYEKTA